MPAREAGGSLARALCLRHPWDWLVAAGHQAVDRRTWATRFHGEFLILAAKTFDHSGYEWVQREMDLWLPTPEEFERGGIVGAAELVNRVAQHGSPWFWGPYGSVLRNARPVPFQPLRGMAGFFPAAGDWVCSGRAAGRTN